MVIDGNQRVFRSFGETRPGNNEHPQLDSVIRIASLSKLMTSEMLVKLLDQGVVKLNDPLSKYAPPGARVPTYQGAPITLVNLATHTSALPREQRRPPIPIWRSIYSPMRSLPPRASHGHSCLKSRLPVRWG